MLPSDMNLVRDSFVKTVKQFPLTKSIDSEILRALIPKALVNGWNLKVLCEKGEPEEVMAWTIMLGRCVLWLCRKPKYKGIGLGYRLFEMTVPVRGPVSCVFLNPSSTPLLATKGYQLQFRPYLAMEIMSYE